MEKTIFDYDPINDSLFISNKGEYDKIKGSIVLDNISLDFTEKRKIVGIEIIGISSYLEEWGFNSEILNQIESAELILIPKNECIFYGICINDQKIPLGLFPINNILKVQNS